MRLMPQQGKLPVEQRKLAEAIPAFDRDEEATGLTMIRGIRFAIVVPSVFAVRLSSNT